MDLSSMKVTDLRKELKKLGLPSVGTKQDLVQRLEGVGAAVTAPNIVELQDPAHKPTTTDDHLLENDGGLLDDDELLGEDDSNESTEGGGVAVAVAVAAVAATAKPAVPSPPKKLKLDRQPIKSDDGIAPPAADQQTTSTAAKIKTKVSEADRLALREKKFGGKLAAAATAGKPTTTDDEVLKKRSERFGGIWSGGNGSGGKPTPTQLDPEKLAKRKERFGEVAVSSTNSVDEKKAKRAMRFK